MEYEIRETFSPSFTSIAPFSNDALVGPLPVDGIVLREVSG